MGKVTLGESAGRYSFGRIWVDPFDDFRHIFHLVSPSQEDQCDTSGGVLIYPEQRLTKRRSYRGEGKGNKTNKGSPEITASIETLGGTDEHVASNG